MSKPEVTKTYQELEMLLGHDDANKIVNACRGQELYIPAPKKLKESHNLVQLLGMDVAQRLCHYWQGNILTIPMQQAKILAARNRAIICENKAGANPSILAKKYSLHVRTVRIIIEKYHNELARQAYVQRQLQLFDH